MPKQTERTDYYSKQLAEELTRVNDSYSDLASGNVFD
jgi:hypothetical protein